MANITITYAEMERAAAQLGAGRDDITERLRAMRARIAELVETGFVTDRASAGFDVAYAEFTESATTVIAKLTEIQAFLTGSADAMREMDARLASRIG